MPGKYRGTINRDKVLRKQLQGQGDPKASHPPNHSVNWTTIQIQQFKYKMLKQLFHPFDAVRLRTKYANFVNKNCAKLQKLEQKTNCNSWLTKNLCLRQTSIILMQISVIMAEII